MTSKKTAAAKQETTTEYGLAEALDATVTLLGQSTTEALRGVEIDRNSATARQYKRGLRAFKDSLQEMATLDQDTATECVYSIPRGGKQITGPSIRFAEMVLVAWGNIDVSTTIIRDDHVAAIVQGRAHDLETNVSLAMEARRPVHKKRSKAAPDEDDKQLAVSVASSLARRNVILAIVPKALWAGAYFAAIDASTGVGTMEFKRGQAIEAFAKLGASEAQVLVALGRKGPEEINIEDLRHLRGMYTAIRDKNLRLEDALRPPEPEKPRGRTEAGNTPRSNHPLAPAAATPAVVTSPIHAEPASDFDPETGEVSQSDLESFLPDVETDQ